MESDDEWITESEDPCLPVDTSWMDMNECFEVNDGETSEKRRRGIFYGLQSFIFFHFK